MRNDLHSCLLQAYSYGKLEVLGMGSELLKLMPGKSPTSHYIPLQKLPGLLIINGASWHYTTNIL